MKKCTVRMFGEISYGAAMELQKKLVLERQAGRGGNVLLLLEHAPVFTLGRRGTRKHLLVDESRIRDLGADVVLTNRGGDITYHGPGQLVAYPILDLREWRYGVSKYLGALEEVMIRLCRCFGVEAARQSGLTGVWVNDRKIGAIGVHLSRWVTSHGFALNVETDLDYFHLIIPCGIVGKGVTSLREELGRGVPMDAVRASCVRIFGEVFECSMQDGDAEAKVEKNIVVSTQPEAVA